MQSANHNPNRRTLLALAGALPLAAAPAVAATGLEGADGELIRCCRLFCDEDELVRRWNAGGVSWEIGEAALNRWHDLAWEIVDLSPTTEAGRQAKAEVAWRALDSVAADRSGVEEELAIAVLKELTGRA